MANTRRSRSYRGGSKRTAGSGALIDTVRNTITGIAGSRGRGGRSGGGGGLASQATGFIGGLLSGSGSGAGNRNRNRGRRRR